MRILSSAVSRRFRLAVLATVALCAGCSLRLADMTVISTRNVNLDRVDLDSLEGTEVEGSDSGWTFLIIPFSFPHLEDAIDDALKQGNGDIMTDAVVHVTGWWFLIGEQRITVKGKVVKTRLTADVREDD